MTTLTPRNKRIALLCAISFLNLSIVTLGSEMKETDITSTKQNKIKIKDFAFAPATIKVGVGEALTWTNNDNFTHTVKVDGREDHKVGRGDSVSITFDRPGSYHYICTLHSKDMDGTVIVT